MTLASFITPASGHYSFTVKASSTYLANLTCHHVHCNKTGHTSDNCYLKHPDKRPSANDSAPQAHYSQHNEPVSTVPTDEENKAYFLQL
ncbi:hypothetical protein KEM48_012055 [Puccinia striiformis f. sp. tritici PST-130]|nr:hypothetical protein KEM48_012055 [Puccinia striiformis f. sp. tritici PST-130]